MKELVSENCLKQEKQKELFIATLVHDLKSPLNAQIIALEQLYKEKFGGITLLQKEILSDIIKSSKFMREMLSSLLSVYKFENGVVKLNKEPVDIEKTVKICLKDIIPLTDENCIFIEYLNLLQDNIVICDKNYIKRVISNMLNNLAEYSYKNSKALVVLEENGVNIIVRFKSKGLPISENLKSHIFEKYNTGLNNKSGTGLGLYFCKKVIEAHSGIISLNAQNSDIEFFIKMPKIEKTKNIIKFS